MIKENEQRWKHTNTCAECGMCSSGKSCDLVRQELRNYNGIRFTSDGFDCALPITIDSHSVCSFGCLYCFSDNLPQHREQSQKKVGQTSLKTIEKLFSGKKTKFLRPIQKALKYDNRNKHGYPCPVQLGGITDPLDNIERQQGWFKNFAKLCIKYNQPVRISTKGIMGVAEDYKEIISRRPELFWFAFSIITPDTHKASKIEKRCPSPEKRLKAMKELSDLGCNTSLRFRPIIPGISDSTNSHPDAYKELIKRAAEAGADAISYETVFLDGMPQQNIKKRYKEIEEITGVPLRRIYKQFGKPQKCTRPSYKWTDNIMHAIKKEALKNNMWVGISDPNWKQLTDCGCCCGIPRNHPVFGNWQRESATNRLMEAKIAKNRGKEILIGPKDIIPEWSKFVPEDRLVNPGAGPAALYKRKYRTWADKLRETWNDINKERSALIYFQGALLPHKKDKKGNIFYKYKGLKRQNKSKIPFWKAQHKKIEDKEKEWYKNIDFSQFKTINKG